ncbi:MAG: hemerythrin domain-containing protein [candidate division Zixibacteria bacterium]|nr:hemerythrin domain-containing protein [candidate division Zixibacteria bacterium]
MKPTQILSDEHRIIEVILDSLQHFVTQSRAAVKVDRDTAEQFIDFIRTFADGCHHGKEENHLFVMLEEKGAPREHGPVGVMLHEHDLGRSFLRGMAESLPQAAAGDAAAVTTFCENAQNYIGLLRAHIMKEDQILFPLADRMLTEEDQSRLQASFTHVEAHDMGEGTHTRYLEMALGLANKFNVPAEPIKRQILAGGCTCAHGHKSQSQTAH